MRGPGVAIDGCDGDLVDGGTGAGHGQQCGPRPRGKVSDVSLRGGRDVARSAVRVCALAAAVAFVITPARGQARGAPATAPQPFGINGGVLWPDGNKLLPTARHADAIGASSLRSVRAIPFWDLIERFPPGRAGVHSFDWRTTDPIAENLARNGLRWDALLGFSTPWAGDVPGTTAGPPRTAPFSEYAAGFAARYGRNGAFWKANPQLPYTPVTSYQVWNEPNLPGSPTAIAAPRYAELYLATRKAVLAVDPHARVAVGGLVHSSPSGDGNAGAFLREMFAARPDLSGNIDAVGITIYRQNPAQILGQVASARALLDELGERRTPLDINETGWTTNGTVPLTDITAVTDERRSELFSDLVRLLVGADCGLGTVTPFAWVSAEDNPLDASAFFGVADRMTAALKPSGRALVAAIRAATDPGAAAAGGICGRADLPRLLEARRRKAVPLVVASTRRCAGRRLSVRFSLGADPEPFQRLEIALPGGVKRTVQDPDAGGPALAPTSVKLPFGKRPRGRVTVTAFDELGRERARVSAPLSRCRVKTRR